MTFGPVHFAAPIWLAAGLLLTLSVLLLELRLARQRRTALTMFSTRLSSATASLSPTRRAIKGALLLLGTLCTSVALARPQLGFRVEETYRRGIDLMFVIDTSKSMLSPDLEPNRLTRAKLAIDDLVSKFPGDRVGLVAFAGDAFLQCPLTLDRAMFEQTLQAVDTNIIPRGGTDLGRGLDVATEALASQPANRKLVVVLSDGEDLEAHAIAEAEAANRAGVRIFTVGVGTPGGELVPDAHGGFIRDASGTFVRSRLDEATLKKSAGVTGGDYRALGADGQGLERLYDDVLGQLPRDALAERLHRVPLERFQWPLAAGAFCFVAEALLGERRRRRGARTSRARSTPLSAAAAIGALVLVGALVGAGRTALASVSDAEAEYRAGKFEQSAAEYGRAAAKAPTDPRLSLNAGTAAYKAGEYDAATAEISKTLHAEGRLELQEPAYYDLGNTLYRMGQATTGSPGQTPEQTIDKWKQAISAYDGALKLNADDADARFNRDLVKRKLAELMKKQQEKKQDQTKQANASQSGSKPKGGEQQQAKNDQGGQSGKSGNTSQGQGQQGSQSTDQGQQGQQGQAQNDGSKTGQGGSSPASQSPGQNEQKGAGPKQAKAETPKPTGSAGSKPQINAQAQSTSASQGAAPQGSPPIAMSTEDQDGPARPGHLSRQDARALLDSLRGDEQLFASGPENGKPTDDAPVRKDW